MPKEVGKVHYIPFHSSVSGLTTVDFPIIIFTVDSLPASPTVFGSFSVTEIGHSGYYNASYIPDTEGFHYLGITNIPNSIDVIDGADIETGITVSEISENTGGVGALRPNRANIEEFMLFVFNSNDWNVGRTTPDYAQASTQLDEDGHWISSPLSVQPGTYHIVLINDAGDSFLLKASLKV